MTSKPRYRNNLKELLVKNKITNKKFAEMINRSENAVSYMRTGRISIRLWQEDFFEIFNEPVHEELING